MPRHSIALESLAPPPPSRIDVAIEALVYPLLAFMPLAFGAVEAWSELVVCAGVAAASLLGLFRAVQTGAWRMPTRAAWIAAVCVLALPAYAAFQATPLPRSLVEKLAPANAAAYDEQLQDLAVQPAEISISLDRHATARRGRLLLVAASFFFLAATIRDQRAALRLLTVMFAVGLAEAALALLQTATFAEKIYWSYDAPGRATSGSFVNYSNFSQFMNLTIGAGAALWIVRSLHDSRRRRDVASALDRVQGSLNRHGWLVAGMVMAALSVLTSMSRNGAVSLAVGAIVAGTLMWRRGTLGWRGWALVAAPVALFFVLLLTALDTVYERLATVRDQTQIANRWELTQGTLRGWQAFPVWGAGFDAHAVVFPMFDSAVTPTLAEHADNDYAQWLEETGVVGTVIAAALAGAVAALAWRLMMRGRRSTSYAAFGLTLGLAAVAIHSATDFGQRLPAVFSLTALSCGLLVSLTRIERQSSDETFAADPFAEAPWQRTLVRAAPALLAGAAAWGVALNGAYGEFVAERWRWTALGVEQRIAAAAEEATEEQFADLIAAAENAVAWAPTSAEDRYKLNVRRWQTLEGAFQPSAGEETTPAAFDAVRQIAADLGAARSLAPTYGPPLALEGQLRTFILDEEQGPELVRRAVKLAPFDSTATLMAGLLAASEGKNDEAKRLLNRTVQLAPQYFSQVVRAYVFALDQPEWARELAGDNPGRLSQAAAVAEEDANDRYAEFAASLRGAAEEILRRRAEAGDASADELASLARIDAQSEELAGAVALYRRALGLDYGQVAWRMELARLLAAEKQYKEAIREARIVLRLRPEHPQAQQLIGQWTVLVEPD